MTPDIMEDLEADAMPACNTPSVKLIAPETLLVEVGSLRITTATDRTGTSPAHLPVEVQIDGKPVRVRKLNLHVEAGKMVTAAMEFYP